MPTTQYNLHLKGFVGGADFDRNYVDYVLERNSGKPVTVLIDSLGGSVATALSIASAFRNHADVSVHFVGMNASAATIASLGAKHISIDANAMYLVHKCSQGFFEWGSLNADQFATLISECEKVKADLDKLDLNIARMYAARCSKVSKKTCADLLDLMKRGGWLSAGEAKEWGFVDEITDAPGEAAPRLTDAVASDMAAAGIPIPNIPLADSQGAFSRFFANAKRLRDDIASLASLFRTTPKPQTDPDMTTAQTDNPQSPADTAEIDRLTAQLAERDATIASLNEQLAKYKTDPADSSRSVVEDAKPTTATTEDPLAEYCKNVAEASQIFNSLP